MLTPVTHHAFHFLIDTADWPDGIIAEDACNLLRKWLWSLDRETAEQMFLALCDDRADSPYFERVKAAEQSSRQLAMAMHGWRDYPDSGCNCVLIADDVPETAE